MKLEILIDVVFASTSSNHQVHLHKAGGNEISGWDTNKRGNRHCKVYKGGVSANITHLHTNTTDDSGTTTARAVTGGAVAHSSEMKSVCAAGVGASTDADETCRWRRNPLRWMSLGESSRY